MNYTVINPNGAEVRAQIKTVGRKGTKSPKTYLIVYGGRTITPYEQKLRHWRIPTMTMFSLMFKEHYNDGVLQKLIPERTNWLMKALRMETWKGGTYAKPEETE